MDDAKDNMGSVNLKGAALGLFSALFILLVELMGQRHIEASLKPQLEALRAQYAYSQQFYHRQLDSFEEAMAIVRQVEDGAGIARLNGETRQLLGALASWSRWQEENHLYMSRELLDMALAITRSGTQFIGASQGENRSTLAQLSERISRVKDRLRREARDPIAHLRGEGV